jgi:CMP-N,N'-diacetyllegionaminic acid synthase
MSKADLSCVDALIPARGGSVGIPRKNMRLVAGRPLIDLTIDAATHCRLVRSVYVSTDDEEIARHAERRGVLVIHRPPKLAANHSAMADTVSHALEERPQLGPYIALLQPTSPLRNANHLEQAILSYRSSAAETCISVTDCEQHPLKSFLLGEDGHLQPIRSVSDLQANRQQLPRALRQNGAIYLFRRATFIETRSFFIAPALPFVMPPEVSLDVDRPEDLELCAQRLAKT